MLFSLTQLVFLFNAAGIASLCLVVAILFILSLQKILIVSSNEIEGALDYFR